MIRPIRTVILFSCIFLTACIHTSSNNPPIESNMAPPQILSGSQLDIATATRNADLVVVGKLTKLVSSATASSNQVEYNAEITITHILKGYPDRETRVFTLTLDSRLNEMAPKLNTPYLFFFTMFPYHENTCIKMLEDQSPQFQAIEQVLKTPTTIPATLFAKKPFKLKLDKSTTHIISPLLPDGTPEYLTAYQLYFARDITLENNAGYLIHNLFYGSWPEGYRGGPIPPLPLYAASIQAATQLATTSPSISTTPPPEYVGDLFGFDPNKFTTEQERTDWEKLQLMKRDSDTDPTLNRPWNAQEFPLLASWLTAREAPLKQLTLAAQRPRYYLPQMDIMLFNMPGATRLSPAIPSESINFQRPESWHNILMMRAMFFLGSGNFSAALEDIHTIRRLGRLITQEPSEFSFQIATQMEIQSWLAEITIAQQDSLKPSDCSELLAEALSTTEFQGSPAVYDIGNRYEMLDNIINAAKGNLEEVIYQQTGIFGLYVNGPVAYLPHLTLDDVKQTDWNLLLQITNQKYDELTQIASENTDTNLWAQALTYDKTHPQTYTSGLVFFDFSDTSWQDLSTIKHIQKFHETLEAFLKHRPNETQAAYTHRISILFMGDHFSAQSMVANILRPRTYQRQLQLVLALRQYREATGAYPATLAELAPKYLPQIPNDPFSGQPMKYQKQAQGYLLYSFGLNRKDDGGKTYPEQIDADDIVVKIDH